MMYWALLEVPHDQIGLYGCAAVETTGETDVVRITGLVEKPAPADAPSNLAIIGRYVLSPEIFDVIKSEITARYPTAQFIDYEAFGNIHGSDEEEKASLDLLPERMREHGADGAVVAVGA